jgi:hypothetical protein
LLYQNQIRLIFELLLEAAALSASFAEVSEVGAADLRIALNHDLFDHRGAEQESAFDANTIAGHAANSEVAGLTFLADTQNGALKLLDTLALAFFDLDVHADLIAGAQGRDIFVYFSFN